jgi:hypothetical protein
MILQYLSAVKGKWTKGKSKTDNVAIKKLIQSEIKKDFAKELEKGK